MKRKIQKIVVLPMLYGILAGCVVAIALLVLLLVKYMGAQMGAALIASAVISLLTIIPATRVGAWAYSNVRKYHNAEYFYNLGNGMDNLKAMRYFEHRATKAVGAWTKRHFVKNSFSVILVTYLLFVARDGQWLTDLWVFLAFGILFLAIEIGVWTMLFVARKLCYDKFGNLKNN